MAEDSINIPSLIVVVLVGFVILRWFFHPSSSAAASDSAVANRNRRRVDPRTVEHVMQMFPHADRRSVEWDLRINGGNVAATTERMLSGQGLETPPISFQASTTPTATTSSTNSSKGNSTKSPDLITRYNLTSRLNEPGPSELSGESGMPKNLWSQDKTLRHRLMQDRRDEMILAARRKLLEEDRQRKG